MTNNDNNRTNPYGYKDSKEYKESLILFENLKKNYLISFMGVDGQEEWIKREPRETNAELDSFEVNRMSHQFTGSVGAYTNVVLKLQGIEKDWRPFQSWIDILSIVSFNKKKTIEDITREVIVDNLW